MLIRMTQTVMGSPDGIRTQAYQGGEVYDLPPNAAGDLAVVFIREGWAVPVDSPAMERAVLSPPPERAVKRGRARG